MLSAHDVARELRRRIPGAGDVRIHKLLYYAQGWHLAWTGKPLFGEAIEAWANGPVVASLWRDEKRQSAALPPGRELDEEALATVSYVLARYGGLSGQELIRLTHAERPWIDVSEQADGSFSPEITHCALVQFFADDEVVASVGPLLEAALRDPDVGPVLRAARGRMGGPGTRDDPEEIAARLAAG